jgi:REJ domain
MRTHLSLLLPFKDAFIGGVGLFGGCSRWNIGTGSGLTVLAISQQIKNITLISYSTLHMVHVVSSCDDARSAALIIKAVTAASKSISTVQCSGLGVSNSWSSRQCDGGTVALCVGCADPCKVDQCPGIRSLNPCVSTPSLAYGCSALNSSVSSYRILTGTFVSISVPPGIVSITYVIQKTSVILSVSLATLAGATADGTVFCNAFAPGIAPNSVADVTSENYVNSSTSGMTQILIEGLSPSAQYDLYCATQSSLGSFMALSDVIKTKTSVASKCCKSVTVSLSILSMPVGISSVSSVRVVLDAPPTTSLTVSLVTVSAANSVSTPLFPSSTSISATSSVLTFYYSISALDRSASGLNSVTASLSGTSAAEYTVVYSTDSNFTLSDNSPKAPSLVGVRFSSTGSYLSVQFNSATDSGLISSSSFPCSVIFSFPGVNQALCNWDSATSVVVKTGSGAIVVPGDTFILLGQNGTVPIRAFCQSSVSQVLCAGYSQLQYVSTIVGAPLVATQPIVSISAPSVIGRFDAYVLDFSSSQNAGGRPFKSSFVIRSDMNTSKVQYFYNHLYKAIPPTPVPAGTFPAGSVNNIVVTLCNFLGKCRQSSQTLIVTSTLAPIVSIAGSSSLVVTTSAGLTLNGNGQSGNKSSASLTFLWSAYENGAEKFNIISTSKQYYSYKLSPYTLKPGSLYAFVLTVFDPTSLLSSTKTVSVNVVQGVIVARLAGGKMITMSEGYNTTLDASASYDTDILGKRNPSTCQLTAT